MITKSNLQKKLFLLSIGQYRMLGYQLMLGNIDHKFLFHKSLQIILWCHILKRLFRRWCHCLLNHNNRPCNILLLHSLTVHFDRFDCYFWIFRKKDKHLISWIIRVSDQNCQIFARWTTLAIKLRVTSGFI